MHTDTRIYIFLKYKYENITDIYYPVGMEVSLPDTGLAEHLVALFHPVHWQNYSSPSYK